MDKAKIRAVVFDYGNTLVEFGRAQVEKCDAALGEGVAALYGAPDMARLCAIRTRNRLAPYQGDPPEYRENDLNAITTDLVRELYDREPSKEEVAALIRVRFEVFVSVIECAESVRQMLGRLKRTYRLGVASNYPGGRSIRASMDKVGLTEYFDAVLVSGDLGLIKPHPLVFETIAKQLDAKPEEILFVGDNWLADIQGAKRAGMHAALTTQWERAEKFEPQPGDIDPDLTVAALTDLEKYL